MQYSSKSSLILLIIYILLFVESTYATPAFHTLGGADELLPFSSGIGGDGPSLTYSNPAGLTRVRTHFQVGIVSLYQDFSLSFGAKNEGNLISDRIYQARQLMGSNLNNADVLDIRPLPSNQVPAPTLDQSTQFQTYLNLGFQKNLFSGLSIGASFLIPLIHFESQVPIFTDERAQYFGNQLTFERWGDAFEGLNSTVGIGYQLHPSWSIGLGVLLLNRSQANSQVFLGDANYQAQSYVVPQVEVNNQISPFGSIEGRWTSGHILGRAFVSVHAPQSIQVKGQSRVKIWKYPYPEGENALVQRFKQSYRVLPLRVQSGIHLQIARWSLNTTLGWGQWSQYTNRFGELSGWKDQWDGSIGGSRETEWGAYGLDVRWRPTPAPPQIGRNQSIDPSQLAGSVSTSYHIADHLDLHLQTQIHVLVERTDTKRLDAADPVIDEFPVSIDQNGDPIEESVGLQTNHPGYPFLTSKGIAYSLILSLRFYTP